MDTVFVNVYRVLHDDYMYIPKEVQEQYPDRFVLQVEEEKKEEAVEVKPTSSKKKVSSK